MVSTADLNPAGALGIDGISIGGMGVFATVLLVIVIAIVILGIVGGIIWWWYRNRKYFIDIPYFEKLGGQLIWVDTYDAMKVPIGKAGDELWYIKQLNKYIPPAEKQIAKHSYPHYKRKDGELINFNLPDISTKLKEAKVKWVHQDMRAQRIATANLLKKRLQGEKWWQKYQHVIATVILFLVMAIAIVIIFYQFSKIVETLGSVASKLNEALDKTNSKDSLVPEKETAKSIIPLIMFGIGSLKRKLGFKK
ncbi:MAG: hypothetical protein ACOC1X_02225 [Promethearchaeota archaeon]